MRIVFLSALSAAVACATASAQTATLRYKFTEGEKLQYVIEQKMKITVGVMNMEYDKQINTTLDTTWTVLSVDRDGSAQVQFTVIHARMSIVDPAGIAEVDSAQKNDPDDLIGKAASLNIRALAALEMTGTMLATGEVKYLKLAKKTIEAMKKLADGEAFTDSFKSSFSSIVFPTDAVAKGKTWTSETAEKTPNFKVVTGNTFTNEGTVPKDGVKLEKISIKQDVKIEPAPNAPIKEIKEAKGSGQILFDAKAGRLIESVVNQRIQMQITLAGTELDQTSDQTTTMRLKK